MERFPLAPAGFHLNFWATAQNTQVLQVGLRAKVTPQSTLAAGGSKGLEGTPAWHTEEKVTETTTLFLPLSCK